MCNVIRTYLDFWSKFNASGDAPHMHPADAGAIDARFQFELDLLPAPFTGDLLRADIVIAMLNPGLSDDDLLWNRDENYVAARCALLQRGPLHELDYPFIYLDPRFADHPGAGFWFKRRGERYGDHDMAKLSEVAHQIAAFLEVPLDDVRRQLARRICLLQLVPYHSAKIHARERAVRLPSAAAARELLHGLVAEGKKDIIVMRAARAWGIEQQPARRDRVVVYPRGQARAASLRPHSAGGAAILRAFAVPQP